MTLPPRPEENLHFQACKKLCLALLEDAAMLYCINAQNEKYSGPVCGYARRCMIFLPMSQSGIILR
jgi:hypothetical protein